MFRKSVGASLLALLPLAAAAQEADGESDAGNEIVITATGTEQDRALTGQAIALLDRNDLDTIQFSAASDVLSTLPGVTTTRTGGIGGVSAVRIRGAEGDQTLVIVDGVRLNDPSAPGGAFDFGNLLTGSIERIELLKGPGSVVWGSQAIGGVVNIVTALPADGFGGSARLEAGAGDRVTAAAQAGGSAGPVSASIGAGYFRDDGVSAFRNGIERDGFRQYAVNGRVMIRLDGDAELDFRLSHADGRNRIDGFPPPLFAFADTPEFATTSQVAAYAGANLRLFDGRLKSRLAFTLSDINRDNFDAPGMAAPAFLARGRTERFEYQGDAALGDDLRAVFGIEHERTGFGDGFALRKTRVTSAHAQMVVRATEALTMTGGIRLDDHRAYGSRTTLAANLAWQAWRGGVIRAAYGEGFKAPTLFQLFSAFGNAALKPETARSIEAGIEHSLVDQKLVLAGTFFERRTRNQIDFISCFGQSGGICTGRPFGTFDNVDRTRARGLEAEIRVKPVASLTMEAGYALIDTRDRTTGLRLLRRPLHSLSAAIDWQPAERLSVGGTLQLVSDSADTDFETFARTRLDGYALAGVRASYKLGQTLELYGRIENLFDAQYDQVSGYGTYGRNAHLGIRARF